MSKFTFTATMDENRIQTLQMYLTKKDSSVETRLDEFLDKLYNATVPQQVRDFLDERDKLTAPPKPPRPASKPPAAKPPTNDRREGES